MCRLRHRPTANGLWSMDTCDRYSVPGDAICNLRLMRRAAAVSRCRDALRVNASCTCRASVLTLASGPRGRRRCLAVVHTEGSATRVVHISGDGCSRSSPPIRTEWRVHRGENIAAHTECLRCGAARSSAVHSLMTTTAEHCGSSSSALGRAVSAAQRCARRSPCKRHAGAPDPSVGPLAPRVCGDSSLSE